MPLSSAEPFFNVHTVIRHILRLKVRMERGLAGMEERKKSIFFHRFLEPNVEHKAKKKKKKEKILLLPTVWKGDLSKKNTSIPQSLITLGLHAHIQTIALKSLN